VTGIKTTGEKKLMLFSGRAHPDLAKAVASELGVELVATRAFDFANGEIYVRFEESARGADCFLMQSHTRPINQWIMEQLVMLDALSGPRRGASPSSSRSTATPGRTRSTAVVSPSPPG